MRTDREIVEAIEGNTAEFLLALVRAGGGEERDEAGRLQWTMGGSPIAYHNAVVRAELSEAEAEEAIEASVARMRALEVPGCWHVGPSMRPLDLCDRLRAHGFSDCHSGAEPGMAAPLGSLPDDVADPDELVIERVSDARQLDEFRRVLASGFGEGEPEANWVCAMYERIGLADETNWRHYLGRLGDAPVSTMSVFFAAGVAGLYFVCTSPDRRRMGIGAATTLAAMRAARDEGYDWAVLTSSAMGYRDYEQLGFREYCQICVPEFVPETGSQSGSR